MEMKTLFNSPYIPDHLGFIAFPEAEKSAPRATQSRRDVRMKLRSIFRSGLIMMAASIIASGNIFNPAMAQSSGTGGMALDGRIHPGSPITGWTGNISPSDPYSAGPNMGAWITRAGLIHSRAEVGVG